MIALLLAVSIESNALILHDACFRQGSILACSALPVGSISTAAEPSLPTAVPAAQSRGASDALPISSPAAAPLDRHDRILHYASLQAIGAGFDLWTTGHCLEENPQCKEGNPLGTTTEKRVALKMVHIGAFAWGANALDRRGHTGWAKAITFFGVAVQAAAGINNLVIANK